MRAQELNDLRKEISDLKIQLEKSNLSGSAAESQTLDHLNRLLAANDEALESVFADLKQFWLSSVDWCSDLSRQIEKLIIIQADMREAQRRP